MKQHVLAQPQSSSGSPSGRSLVPVRSQLQPKREEGKERSPALNGSQGAIAPLGHSFASLALYAPEVSQKPVIQPKRPGNEQDQKPLAGGSTQSNRTGLPDQLKTGLEHLSGYSLDDVRVHYNSSQPEQLNALAYAQGSDIHIAPGQERHLPHEAWHVVQQAQGRVKPTMQMKGGVQVNDAIGLEREADLMGTKAMVHGQHKTVGKAATVQKYGGQKSEIHSIEQITHSVKQADSGRASHVIQLYKKFAGTGKQGGNFIYGSKQIHLHIDIGVKSHLKIEGKTKNIATKGGLLDKGKIQEALEELLQFQTDIATDKPRATQYAEAIKDCCDWMVENGAVMPKEPEVKVESPESGKKVEEVTSSQGYGSFFVPEAMTSNKSNSNIEDDFM